MMHAHYDPYAMDIDDFEEPANDNDGELVELDVVGFIDYQGRKLDAIVGWNPLLHEAEWIEVFDEEGEKVEADTDTREAIVVEALK